jgi:hypothetical protein
MFIEGCFDCCTSIMRFMVFFFVSGRCMLGVFMVFRFLFFVVNLSRVLVMLIFLFTMGYLVVVVVF